MRTYDTFASVWNDFGAQSSMGPFDEWVFAHITSPQTDSTGTPLYSRSLITIANPVSQQSQELILNTSSQEHSQVTAQYRARFLSQYPARFGLFAPSSTQADDICATWEAFTERWLTQNGKSILHYNLPLLFDHVSDAQYWAWQQKGFNPCGTQRLIVTIFQYRTGRFAEIFIPDVTDAEFERIKLLAQSTVTLASDDLFV